MFVGIGSGEIHDKVCRGERQATMEGVVKVLQIKLIRRAVRQGNVEISIALGEGIVPGSVHREREDRGITLEDRCGAVSLVDIQIDDDGAANGLFALQDSDGDSSIIENAEALTMRCTGMMSASGQVH